MNPLEFEEINGLRGFKDKISKGIFGKTAGEARSTGLCIDCGEEALPRCYSKAGKREFYISGMCEECFDKIV